MVSVCRVRNPTTSKNLQLLIRISCNGASFDLFGFVCVIMNSEALLETLSVKGFSHHFIMVSSLGPNSVHGQGRALHACPKTSQSFASVLHRAQQASVLAKHSLSRRARTIMGSPKARHRSSPRAGTRKAIAPS